MTKEEKQLLLKDLCMRLPYKVMVEIREKENQVGITVSKYSLRGELLDIGLKNQYHIRPYLRPMSSMTEEEFELLKQYSGLEYDQLDLAEFPNNHKCLDFYLSEIPSYAVIQVFDWLNAHHFDYRGLIPMGLALEAPEGMYKTE